MLDILSKGFFDPQKSERGGEVINRLFELAGRDHEVGEGRWEMIDWMVERIAMNGEALERRREMIYSLGETGVARKRGDGGWKEVH